MRQQQTAMSTTKTVKKLCDGESGSYFRLGIVREGLPEEVTFLLKMKEILCEPRTRLSDFVSLICCGLLSKSQCTPAARALSVSPGTSCR